METNCIKCYQAGKLIGLNFQVSKRPEFNENSIKNIYILYHSHLLDMRLVIANSALHVSLGIYHLIANARLVTIEEIILNIFFVYCFTATHANTHSLYLVDKNQRVRFFFLAVFTM